MESTVELRTASMEDLEVLNLWNSKPHVIAAAPNEDWAWETELGSSYDWQEILMAQIDGRPIGVIVNIDPQLETEHYWGDIGSGYRALDIFIGEENDLGKGYGTQMMTLVLDRCFALEGVHSVIIDPLESNKDAIRFYERIGFEFVEQRRFDQDDCLVYKITKTAWLKL